MISDDQILEFQTSKANAIVQKLNGARRDSAVTKAIELLLGGIVRAGSSLRVLREHSPHDFAFDGAMILRGIYDAMLQSLYILGDPSQREVRAGHYLDYRWVEKKNAIRLFDNSPTYLGRHVALSPRRPNAEPAIEQEFERVRPTFESAKGKLRDHWYEGNLRDLARAVGLESEYELLQKHLSGVVHSSAYALQEAPAFGGYLLMDMAWRFSFRVLGKLADYAQIKLDDDEAELVGVSQSNVFGDPNRSLPAKDPGVDSR